ncbi:unnamed protein product [Linum tenue]|uniref:Uncharacterized protein n=1 Tax=Linum tenue TaxID=586396 RepID=A0AAV0LGP4_9ROSI|nr:unnamed protein product [Linum tenue]
MVYRTKRRKYNPIWEIGQNKKLGISLVICQRQLGSSSYTPSSWLQAGLPLDTAPSSLHHLLLLDTASSSLQWSTGLKVAALLLHARLAKKNKCFL